MKYLCIDPTGVFHQIHAPEAPYTILGVIEDDNRVRWMPTDDADEDPMQPDTMYEGERAQNAFVMGRIGDVQNLNAFTGNQCEGPCHRDEVRYHPGGFGTVRMQYAGADPETSNDAVECVVTPSGWSLGDYQCLVAICPQCVEAYAREIGVPA